MQCDMGNNIIPLTQGKKKKAEIDRDKNIERVLQGIGCINEALIKTGSEPLTLAFVFQDLAAIATDMLRIAEKTNQGSKRQK